MLNEKKNAKRRGIVAILVAVSLTMLMGMVAVTLDGGLLQDNKRRLQHASHAPAIAAANQLFAHYPTILSTLVFDPGSAGDTAARQAATDNGFVANGTDTIVDVYIPPASGPFKGKVGYAEV